MSVTSFRPGTGPGWPVLLLVAAATMLAAQSQAWGSAVTTATTVYSAVMAKQDLGSRP